MQQRSSKSWWQTAAGLVTAVAALITATAGLIAALAQAGFFAHDNAGRAPAPSASATPRTSASSTQPTSKAHRQELVEPSAPSVAGSSPVRTPIQLPARREYVLGRPGTKARYILADATLAQHSGESSMLSIAVRLSAEGMPGYTSTFATRQFSLAIGDDVHQAQPVFTEYVRSGDSIERYVKFTIPPRTTKATLRIKVGGDSHAEIPLELASVN